MDGLDLRVRLEPGLAQLAPDAALLDAAERHAEVAVVAAVDPDHAGLDLGRDAVRALDVAGEDGGAEAVGGVVGLGQGLLLGAEAGDDDEGAEDLLAVDAHGVRHVGEDGGRDEEAAAAGDVLARLAARHERGALGLAALDVRQHALVLRPGDLRALEGLVVEGVADLAGLGDDVLEQLDEPVVDGVLHEDARGGGADLALVGHDADVRPLGGLLEVRVLEDQQRRLAARLQRHVLERGRGHLHDLPARGRGAGEGDLVDVRVLDDGRAGNPSQTVQDVDDAGREAGLLDQVGKIQDAERGLLRRLQHDRVAARERGAQLPRGHGQGVVPGDDLAHDADGLADGVGELGGGGADGLAKDLVGPSGVVSDGADDLGEILGQGDGIRFSCRRSASMSTASAGQA